MSNIFNDICYPVSFDDIDIFEQNNQKTRINIFKYNEEKDEINPARISNNKGCDIIYLLLLSNEDNEHYIYIKILDIFTEIKHIIIKNYV